MHVDRLTRLCHSVYARLLFINGDGCWGTFNLQAKQSTAKNAPKRSALLQVFKVAPIRTI